MRIVYTAPYGVTIPSRAAHSLHMVNMAAALAQLGHEVLFLMPKNQGEDPLAFYGLSQNFTVKQVMAVRKKWFLPIYSLMTLRQTLKFKPDLVISRSALCCLFAAWTGHDVVFDAHGPQWGGRSIHSLIYSFLSRAKHLKRMTVNSNALKKMFIENHHEPQAPLIVAHNGSLPHPLQTTVAPWPGRPGVLQVGYTGHLYPGRGLEIIVECAANLPRMDFHVIGGTESDIQTWKARARFDNLYFHGFVTPARVHSYRNMCDVLLAPYQAKGVLSENRKADSSQYMNPIKLLEYMSSRKAIIASDLPPIREILDETNATLVKADDVGAWIKAISDFENQSVREEKATKAYEIFMREFTWSARARKMVGEL